MINAVLGRVSVIEENLLPRTFRDIMWSNVARIWVFSNIFEVGNGWMSSEWSKNTVHALWKWIVMVYVSEKIELALHIQWHNVIECCSDMSFLRYFRIASFRRRPIVGKENGSVLALWSGVVSHTKFLVEWVMFESLAKSQLLGSLSPR